ncbi:MbcA/ParS/Xre antitoxin family protein [Qipengyuania sp. 1NDH17]|uniref:MbcA/ParS/Xre antitoxin family protein n=1 Tax=Qipengyuania polymorpha TaxID=2867234 RepID=A0ABS7IUM3_9SPHN|nr:MbcA/ParS/Xre antitoxin family protein [Qipengyuania polymorpha]MBX7457114.1 MbcA/ParS/Xre antitoxin family protein [Qipengyuania polymorpha]
MSDRDCGTRLTPAAAKRQSDITRLAMIVLGREAAISFMNEPNDQLGGRPIDLVIQSEEGRERVELELAEIEYLQAFPEKE